MNESIEEIPETTLDEISLALKQMKNNEFSGDDDIVIEDINRGRTASLKVLQILFNRCLEEGKTAAK